MKLSTFNNANNTNKVNKVNKANKSHNNNISGVHNVNDIPAQQFMDLTAEDDLIVDLDRLTKKYMRYQEETYHDTKLDEYSRLLKDKDMTIEDMKKENAQMRQKLIDLAIMYNTKIDELKLEHKRDLRRMHMEFVKKTSNKSI